MLNTTTNNVTYQGGEGRSVFPIPFPFLETAHIRAHVRNARGTARALAGGIDYSVNRVPGANGELVLPGSGLPGGDALTITRLVPLTQEILFHNQGPNSPKAMEEAVDKLTMIAQQLQNDLESRDYSPPPGDAPSGTDLSGVDARLSSLEGSLAALGSRIASLGALATAPDAPANDKPHMRRNGGWVEHGESPSSNPSGGGVIIGEIRFLPFRASELPGGWHFCDGSAHPLSSPQGSALASLPSTMKTDWGITATGDAITVPNLLSEGGGYFVRAVDSSSRHPGSRQTDAIRNITGSFGLSAAAGVAWVNSTTGKSAFAGALKGGAGTKNISAAITNHGYNAVGDLLFDASACVPTADENRPVNVGMTPAIYLGA